mmetsp:Transcript_12756/g.20630  ORF Transcript_12756/g.20630 Transcript_12756/m.20630 type:complete len:359 (+) Transcript_12756:417-1493(+)
MGFSKAEASDQESKSAWSDETEGSKQRKTVLVTGGAGFIGSHTAVRLLERGDKVVVVDEVNDYYDTRMKQANLQLLQKTADEFADPGYETNYVFCKGDIADRKFMQNVFAEHQPTHVCHLAARAGVRPSIDDPFVYVHSNVLGTVTLLELAAQNGISNFVYASSSSVYGGSKKEKFSETDIVDEPVSQYAATKKSKELFAATYHSLYKLNCTGLRFFTVYGPRGRPDMAPFKFINNIVNGKKLDQYGDGSSERDYTYIDDIVNGVVLALDKPLGNAVLNLGRGSPCKLKDFISTIETICKRRAVINMMPMQPGDVPRTCADTSRAEKLIGYRAKVSLKQGLENTLAWYSEWQAENSSC